MWVHSRRLVYVNFPGISVFLARLFILQHEPLGLQRDHWNINSFTCCLSYIFIYRYIDIYSYLFKCPLSSCPHTYLRLEYDISRSPSAVGVIMAVPIFMLALWLTNHWASVAIPIRYHLPAICGHTRGKHWELKTLLKRFWNTFCDHLYKKGCFNNSRKLWKTEGKKTLHVRLLLFLCFWRQLHCFCLWRQWTKDLSQHKTQKSKSEKPKPYKQVEHALLLDLQTI